MSADFEVRIVQTEEELEKVIQLRYKVLREPWNQPFETSRDELEKESVNAFVSDNEGNVIACGRLQWLQDKVCQIRYMAVHPNWQGRGLGAMILAYLEDCAVANQQKEIILQARENALSFYLDHDYRITEKTFLLWGQIQHYLMTKKP